MSPLTNAFGQPVGPPVPGWVPRERPAGTQLEGRYCRVEAVDAERHASGLYAAFSKAPDDRDWTYMAAGPFSDAVAYRTYLQKACAGNDPLHYAVIDKATGRAIGTLALMRIDVANGAIEVGSVMFSPLLKRTRISTEAQYLLMKHVFDDLGYRRYEWKCDSLNAPSCRTAERLGFRFEGIFSQAVVYKGRSRDTAWFSIVDGEWAALRGAFKNWLAPDNFDETGMQRKSLADFRKAAGAARHDVDRKSLTAE